MIPTSKTITAAAVLALGMFTAPVFGAEQPIPSLVYKTGAYAPGGLRIAAGMKDYLEMLNARDGGVGGVKFTVEECETGYNTDRGVECYERTKETGGGATVYNPYSTGITYAIIEKATHDRIPVLSMGYGRTSAADGRVFPYIFNFPASYWSQATAIIRYIGSVERGMDNLRGLRVAYIYLDHPYGKEPIPTLDILSERFGFSVDRYPVAPQSMTEQKSIWLQIRRTRPDYVVMWGWGAMNATAIKEASAVRFPMDKFIGNWWSGSETDVRAAGRGAVGYKSANFHAPGQDFPVIGDIKKYLYDQGRGNGELSYIGEVLYNRAVVNGIYISEAIRVAQQKYGQRQLSGEEVRWGMENLNITSADIRRLGAEGLLSPLKVTCANHEGDNPGVVIQQWTGASWQVIRKWVPAMTDLVRPLIEKEAAQYAGENNITPRNC
ncbi:MAG: ABC transporter substrate-binding protein [Gammaproteobacteria bacterium]|nr:ABC transporter substrate-binding protein [Gammaproteobacteria bacterium]